MGFESVRKMVKGLGDSPFKNLLVNPLYVSLLLTIVILLIVFYILKDDYFVKTGFYVLCSCLSIIFLHNRILLDEYKKKLCSDVEENICMGIDDGSRISGGGENSQYFAEGTVLNHIQNI